MNRDVQVGVLLIVLSVGWLLIAAARAYLCARRDANPLHRRNTTNL